MKKERPGREVVLAREQAHSAHSAGIAQRALDLARSLDLAKQQARILRFPEDRSLGTLFILDRSDPLSWSWREFAQAHGSVSIPEGSDLRLEVSSDARRDLSPLAGLRPNDLYSVQLRQSTGPSVRWEELSMPEITDAELQHIDVWTPEITDAALKHIGYLTGLRDLDLGFTGVSDGGLAALKPLVYLCSLSLFWTRITDAGIALLKSLRNLRSLTLSFTDITDRALSEVQWLVNMEDLDLAYTGVTDRGLVCLRRLKNLSTLYLV